MGFFVELWKLISRSLLTMAVGLLVPILIINPILNHFYPNPSTTKTSSPLISLETILLHRTTVQNLESEIANYLDANHHSMIVERLNQIEVIRPDLKEYSDKIKAQDDGEGVPILATKHEALSEHIDVNLYLRLSTLQRRIAAVISPEVSAVLQSHFDVSREHGIILDGTEVDDPDVEILEENCDKPLLELLELLRQGQKLIETITNVAKQVERRHTLGESLEDLSVSEQTEIYNRESGKLLNRMELVVKRNFKDLSRTSEIIAAANQRLDLAFNKFVSKFCQFADVLEDEELSTALLFNFQSKPLENPESNKAEL